MLVVGLAAAHGLDEVLEVPGRSLAALLEFRPAPAEDLPLGVARDHKVALRSVEDVAVRGACLVVRVPEPDRNLGHLALLLELQQGGQHFRRLPVVVPDVATARRHHLVGQGHAQAPLQHVQLVDPLVSDLAVTEVPRPVPVVVHVALRVGPPFPRPDPEVVVEGRRGLLIRRCLKWGAPLEDRRPSHVHVADRTIAHLLDGLADRLGTAQLDTVLHDPAVLLGGSDQAQALVEGVRGRLLDVHVLAGLAGPDGRQRVPVVWRSDGDDVYVLVLNDRPQVLDHTGPVPVLLLELTGAFAGNLEVGIDEGSHLDVVKGLQAIHVALATTVDAEHSRTDAVVRAQHGASGGECGGRCNSGSCLDKRPAMNGVVEGHVENSYLSMLANGSERGKAHRVGIPPTGIGTETGWCRDPAPRAAPVSRRTDATAARARA